MVEIRLGNIHDADLIAEMVARLLSELVGTPIEKENYLNVTLDLLDTTNLYNVFLAFDNTNKCIGILSATESCSIYAEGRFGIIQELYVLPEYRSSTVGHRLISAVIDFGKTSNWKRLEVGAPDATKWNRTVSFYCREGFKEIGPRLSLKLL